MVCVGGYCGNCRKTFFLWLCNCWSRFLEACINSGKKGEEVPPSISPLLHRFSPHSVFHPLTLHRSVLLAFSFTLPPLTLRPPNPSPPCDSSSTYIYISSAFSSICSSSRVCSSACPLPPPHPCLVTRHENCCCTLNSTGWVSESDGGRWMCIQGHFVSSSYISFTSQGCVGESLKIWSWEKGSSTQLQLGERCKAFFHRKNDTKNPSPLF